MGYKGAALFAWALASAVAPDALATNGLNMIGFGGESMALAGADVAWSSDTFALNTNPALLADLHGPAFDVHAAAAYALDIRHQDGLGNNQSVDNRWAGIASLGYARPLAGGSFVLGFGAFAQGGSGNVYKNLRTPFGGRDELSSLFRIGKLSLGGAWAIDANWSLGAALSLVYADIEQKVFPETSSPAFAGYALDGANALEPGVKIGLRYRPDARFTLGASYTRRTDLEMRGGKLVANFSSPGIGKVRYRDLRLSGLNLPQELALGIAAELTPAWVLSLKLAWLDWSGAVSRATLVARDPDEVAAPRELRAVSTLDWRDQYVFAIGVIHRLDRQREWLAGYNYGRNPSPAGHTQPLLAAIAEHHFTLGHRARWRERWRYTWVVEFQPGARVRYDNPESPFGPGAEERNRMIAVHLGLGARW